MIKKYIPYIVIGLILLYGVSIYNSLVNGEEGIKAQWANVEAAYQERANLVKNLTSIVKGGAEYERETLEAIVNARTQAQSVKVDPNNITQESLAKYQQAQSALGSAINIVVERYPDLKATEGFLKFQNQYEGSENRIRVETLRFNQASGSYNAKVRKIPSNIIATIFGFELKPLFEAEEGSEKAPDIEF